jgi:hypothetical protein
LLAKVADWFLLKPQPAEAERVRCADAATELRVAEAGALQVREWCFEGNED